MGSVYLPLHSLFILVMIVVFCLVIWCAVTCCSIGRWWYILLPCIPLMVIHYRAMMLSAVVMPSFVIVLCSDCCYYPVILCDLLLLGTLPSLIPFICFLGRYSFCSFSLMHCEWWWKLMEVWEVLLFYIQIPIHCPTLIVVLMQWYPLMCGPFSTFCDCWKFTDWSCCSLPVEEPGIVISGGTICYWCCCWYLVQSLLLLISCCLCIAVLFRCWFWWCLVVGIVLLYLTLMPVLLMLFFSDVEAGILLLFPLMLLLEADGRFCCLFLQWLHLPVEMEVLLMSISVVVHSSPQCGITF